MRNYCFLANSAEATRILLRYEDLPLVLYKEGGLRVA